MPRIVAWIRPPVQEHASTAAWPRGSAALGRFQLRCRLFPLRRQLRQHAADRREVLLHLVGARRVAPQLRVLELLLQRRLSLLIDLAPPNREAQRAGPKAKGRAPRKRKAADGG